MSLQRAPKTARNLPRVIRGMMRSLLLGIGMLLMATPGHARDEKAVWGALVYARNSDQPTEAPAELKPFAKKLERTFGYNELSILGQESKATAKEADQWLIPGHDFSLLAKIDDETAGTFQLSLKLFQGKRLLVASRAELGSGSPLVIKGPLYADGQLLILLEVR